MLATHFLWTLTLSLPWIPLFVGEKIKNIIKLVVVTPPWIRVSSPWWLIGGWRAIAAVVVESDAVSLFANLLRLVVWGGHAVASQSLVDPLLQVSAGAWHPVRIPVWPPGLVTDSILCCWVLAIYNQDQWEIVCFLHSHNQGLHHLFSTVSTVQLKKALQGSMTEMRELLRGMEEKSSYLTRVIVLPSKKINHFSPTGNRIYWVSGQTWRLALPLPQ